MMARAAIRESLNSRLLAMKITHTSATGAARTTGNQSNYK